MTLVCQSPGSLLWRRSSRVAGPGSFEGAATLVGVNSVRPAGRFTLTPSGASSSCGGCPHIGGLPGSLARG